ncbi:MAG: D-alanyl-D-alanine carboxypeptidase/D-alanyl-D-alanine-endopeptidase [Succinivibrio sp.]|nr:D-alanyl-D-alanine carboxypeptidase/D-alanyl-D-alanine-endopeptidase [Succinivibrio sp.]
MKVKKSLFGLLVLLCCAIPSAHAISASPHPVEGSNVGVAYLLPGTAQVLGDNIDTYYHPASTQKILSTLSALIYLGPQWRIKTLLLTESELFNEQGNLRVDSKGTLHGDVTVRFSGDPSLTSEKYRQLLSTLSKAGVRRIEGKVQLDVSRFGGLSKGNGWSWNDLPVCFTAPAAPIIINRNCAMLELLPLKLGDLVGAKISRYSPVKVSSTARTVLPKQYGGSCELEIQLYQNNEYHLSGCAPQQPKGQALPLSVSVSDPEAFGLAWTKVLLEDLHIAFQQIVLIRNGDERLREIARHESAPLSELIRFTLHRSNNLFADAIAKNLAAEYLNMPATYPRMARVIKEVLKKRAGVDLGDAYIVDGSGLSPHNLITPRQMLRVMDYINRSESELHFKELLPVSGESGTLRYRSSTNEPPLYNNVTAKTGSLENVINLAGFVKSKSGAQVPFVIFTNSIALPEKVREQVKLHRRANPALAYERYLLEGMYEEKVYVPDVAFGPETGNYAHLKTAKPKSVKKSAPKKSTPKKSAPKKTTPKKSNPT